MTNLLRAAKKVASFVRRRDSSEEGHSQESVPPRLSLRRRLSQRQPPFSGCRRPLTTRGILPGDILDVIFTILREDEIAYWDTHRRFPKDRRYLSTCGLVSSYWREVSLQHLFRDLVFTRGLVVRGACEAAKHPLHCVWCGCACHWAETQQRPEKHFSSFLRFLHASPRVTKHTRSLRVRTSPLDIREGKFSVVNGVVLFRVLGVLPRLAVLHLEDIVLSPQQQPAGFSLQCPPPLEQLTLSIGPAKFWHIPASCIVDTLAHFRRVNRLRILNVVGDGPSPSPQRLAATGSALQAGYITLDNCLFTNDAVVTFLAMACTDHARVRVTIPEKLQAKLGLQTFVSIVAPRLEHLECEIMHDSFPAKQYLARARSPPEWHSHSPTSALDLRLCTALKTLKVSLSLSPDTLTPDLRTTILPLLASLRERRGPAPPLRLLLQCTLAEAQALHDLETQPMRSVLAELEDVLLGLHNAADLYAVTFVLGHAGGCEYAFETDKPGAVMRALLPRLDQRRRLHVATTTDRGT